ncbi:MAG: DMT family transporter [Rhodobiaceae bacterium]|nr:DMT family transporter [Rhodobiaceae bacterium]MCC0017212.1 DMT family transporter [Rhodobiaceae bacterium]MCC0041775.1 DMT family transporter [Rhodobiaceae bacterium]MCC0052491.1 DMT family transporter [Rhodobiaceae bacterium]
MATANQAPIRAATPADLTLLVLLAAVWGSAFMAIKIAVPETGPVWLVALRASIGFLALLPWALYRGWVWPADAREWGMVVALALFNVLIPFFLISWAQQSLHSSTTALLMGSGPLIALLLAHATSHDDKMNLLKLVAVVLGFSGVATVLGVAAFSGLSGKLLPQAAALLASASYVFSGTLVRRIASIPPVRLSTLVLGTAASLFVPIALLTSGPLPELSQKGWTAIVYLGLFPTGLAYILRYQLVRAIGLSVFAHVGNMIPLFGVLFGVALLGEPLTATLAIAAALIFSGLAAARLGSRAKAS